MTSLNIIQKYISGSTGALDQVINIEDAFLASPTTPVSDSKMKNFNEEVLRECILSNIRLQHQNCEGGGLRRLTWMKLVEFLTKDFMNTSETKKIYLQVLVHFSKIYIDEVTTKCYGKLRCFDIMLKRFIVHALEEFSINSMISEMETEKVIELQTRLLSTPILNAILKNITSLNLPNTLNHIDMNYLSKIIKSGRIYETTSFKPFPKLRGAALLDGILICRKNISDDADMVTHNADLLTLAAHGFSHYVVRVLYDNLNFSSPYSCRNSNIPRFDFGAIQRPLEVGRNTELVLFDGVQPDWLTSGVDAATTFLRRIDSNVSKLPVISRNEFEQLDLCERPPSSYFGIDIIPEVKMME